MTKDANVIKLRLPQGVNIMEFVILTGMSGAGKSTALNVLEDIGFFCVDNLPVQLVDKFAELSINREDVQKIALGIDVRSAWNTNEFEDALASLSKMNISYEILFLDADDSTLIKRFKETRRVHPLSAEGRIDEDIALERAELKFLRDRASYVIDTSRLLTRDLTEEIRKIYFDKKAFKSMFVNVVSFGFKYGIPTDADIVFDVRFLPNPFYVDELKRLTGNDKAVSDFVMKNDDAVLFLDKLEDLVGFLIPRYIKEGRNRLIIAIGCTGGQHRSVVLANGLFERLGRIEDIGLKLDHREL